MDIRQITPAYFVAPQIVPDDIPGLAAAGIKTVICNRPDPEVPPGLQAADLQQAVEAAGMAFVILPITHQTLSPALAAEQHAAATNAQAPVLAYCASGTRSTLVWALAQAATRPVQEIVDLAAAAGYDINGLRPTLEAIAAAD